MNFSSKIDFFLYKVEFFFINLQREFIKEDYKGIFPNKFKKEKTKENSLL